MSEYLTEAMTVRLSESLGLTLLPTQASSGTVESSKRKADWEQALEIEKECGSKYNAVSTSSVQPAELPKKLLTKKVIKVPLNYMVNCFIILFLAFGKCEK